MIKNKFNKKTESLFQTYAKKIDSNSCVIFNNLVFDKK